MRDANVRTGQRSLFREEVTVLTRREHEQRVRHSGPRDEHAAELGLELANLANTFPQFKESLNELRNHLLILVKPMSTKYQIVLKSLSTEPMSIEELMDKSAVERAAVLEILASLRDAGEVEQCACDGDELRIRSNGRPVGEMYWRLTCRAQRAISTAA